MRWVPFARRFLSGGGSRLHADFQALIVKPGHQVSEYFCQATDESFTQTYVAKDVLLARLARTRPVHVPPSTKDSMLQRWLQYFKTQRRFCGDPHASFLRPLI